MTDLDDRLDAAWRAILDIKDEAGFDALYVAIEREALEGLGGDDLEAAVVALNAYLASIGKASTDGYV